jgi:hypothetical protein
MAECRGGPLPSQFSYAEYVAEAKAVQQRVGQQEEAIRVDREVQERRKLEIIELLRRFAIPISSRGRVARGPYRPSVAPIGSGI